MVIPRPTDLLIFYHRLGRGCLKRYHLCRLYVPSMSARMQRRRKRNTPFERSPEIASKLFMQKQLAAILTVVAAMMNIVMNQHFVFRNKYRNKFSINLFG